MMWQPSPYSGVLDRYDHRQGEAIREIPTVCPRLGAAGRSFRCISLTLGAE